MTNRKKAIVAGASAYIAGLAIIAGFWGTMIYLVIHFVRKFW